MSTTTDRCLSHDDVTALLDGKASATDQERMLAHLRECRQCANEFELAASRWSLAPLTDTARRGPGEVTAVLKKHIAATPPEMTKATRSGSDTAAIPRRIPVIPGIVDLEPIGRGGMGVVYRGRETTLDRIVAVKVLSAWTPLSDSARQRAEREALMLGQLNHPNIVAIHAAGEAEGTPYLVMEWVPGPTLQKQIDAQRFPPREAARIARDLGRALERVHTLGIVHRDVKPDNVLLATEPGGPSKPKLADFGLARPEASDIRLTQADDVLGTPAYMAAEQTGLSVTADEVGPAADIHGLGGVLFAMLTGHPPYEAATALESMQRAARGDVTHAVALAGAPADLRTIVWKCLEPLPARRYRSAGELADDLDRYLEGRPVLARPISLPERAVKWARRRPLAALAVAVAVAFVIASIVGTGYHVAKLERANEQITRSRDHAEEAMAVAEQSMDRLVGAAIKRMLFRGQALDEGDQEFLRQVRDGFRQWPLGGQPVQSLWFRLAGLRRVAGMFFDVGQYADALACQQGELEVLDELNALVPGDTDVLRERLDTQYRLRFSLYHLQRTDEAAASARESIALLEAAPADFPRRDSDLANTRLYLGAFLHEQKRFDEGSQLIAAAIDTLHSLREHQPDDIELAQQVINALYTAQMYASQAGRIDDRRKWLDQLVSEAAEAIERFPILTENRHERSLISKLFGIGLAQLAFLASDAGNLDEALDLALRREQVSRAFLDGLPAGTIDEVHKELIDANLQLALILLKLDRTTEADAAIAAALAVAEHLVTVQPAVWDTNRLLTRVLHMQAERAIAAGQADVAARIFDREIALLEPWRDHAARTNDAATFLAAARKRRAEIWPSAGLKPE